MEPIIVNRFKPYRKMRWCRSNYLWLETNPYLEKYQIKVHHGEAGPQDVLVIPCPHLPGREAMVHADYGLWIQQGHLGTFDYGDTPMICDSSLDYAHLDPVIRSLIKHPQIRAYLPNADFRDRVVQQRKSWGGEYYGTVHVRRKLYNIGPDVREERGPLSAEIANKIQPLNRPPTPPFSDEVFEYIASKIKPLNQRPVDLFFSGRTRYHKDRYGNYPTAHRKELEEMWETLPGQVKVLRTYDNYDGTLKDGKPVEKYSYPYEYVDALLQAKVVISPWGWSPWCIRDIEALACGCIVVKPECSNMLVFPDIYDPRKQFLVWCDITFAGLADQLNYIYTHIAEMQDRVNRGREFVTDALYPNDKLYASWTKDIRQTLEKALEKPSYTQAKHIAV